MDSSYVANQLLERYPDLEETIPALLELCEKLAEVFRSGGTLFIAGNGGSAADAQHIAGELMKSFERTRPLSGELRARLEGVPEGRLLADNLEAGLPAIALGLNHSLTSAVGNDFREPHLEYAQEVSVLGARGDALLAISTSGRAANVRNAMIVARARGMFVAALTGSDPHDMEEIADLVVPVPGQGTAEVQERHEPLYHAMCRLLERQVFGDEHA
jgi:D-sedoheptulose 7-phosphate isomerase